jgi:hypothetical protein
MMLVSRADLRQGPLADLFSGVAPEYSTLNIGLLCHNAARSDHAVVGNICHYSGSIANPAVHTDRYFPVGSTLLLYWCVGIVEVVLSVATEDVYTATD